MVDRDVRHAPPDVGHAPPDVSAAAVVTPALRRQARSYRPPTLTVYGTVRDVTRGTGIGKPDNPSSQSHSMQPPWSSGAAPGYR